VAVVVGEGVGDGVAAVEPGADLEEIVLGRVRDLDGDRAARDRRAAEPAQDREVLGEPVELEGVGVGRAVEHEAEGAGGHDGGVGVARAGVARVGVARAGVARVGA
ncbi:MAG: hypothetical protein ACK559_31865, partial [bacterium]